MLYKIVSNHCYNKWNQPSAACISYKCTSIIFFS